MKAAKISLHEASLEKSLLLKESSIKTTFDLPEIDKEDDDLIFT